MLGMSFATVVGVFDWIIRKDFINCHRLGTILCVFRNIFYVYFMKSRSLIFSTLNAPAKRLTNFLSVYREN